MRLTQCLSLLKSRLPLLYHYSGLTQSKKFLDVPTIPRWVSHHTFLLKTLIAFGVSWKVLRPTTWKLTSGLRLWQKHRLGGGTTLWVRQRNWYGLRYCRISEGQDCHMEHQLGSYLKSICIYTIMIINCFLCFTIKNKLQKYIFFINQTSYH